MMKVVKDSQDIHKQLQDCQTFEDMLKVLGDTYDLSKVKPGIASKPFLIKGLMKMIETYKPPLK